MATSCGTITVEGDTGGGTECTSDGDCSGDMVCVNGSCVEPTQDDGIDRRLLIGGGIAAAGVGALAWASTRDN